MSDDNPPSSDETSIIRGSAIDSLNTVFERFLANQTPFGFQSKPQGIEFHPMPYRPGAEDQLLLLSEPWRITLELSSDEQRRVLGLDLYGDIILGRGDSRPGRIILNLDPYNAVGQGVSREHLMLRPTKSHLFAIDQGSTNGTMVNGSPSGRGVATVLKDEDLLALSNLLIMVHIVIRPSTAK